MFILKCPCGAESSVTLQPANVLKGGNKIRIQGAIELYINDDWEIRPVRCEQCGSELADN